MFVTKNHKPVPKKRTRLAAQEITQTLRNDFEEYLMGQVTQIQISKKRNLKLDSIVTVFTKLIAEKLAEHKRITAEKPENTP